MTPETTFTDFPKPDVSATAVVEPASDQAAGDPGPESPPAATDILGRFVPTDGAPIADTRATKTEPSEGPAAGSTPAAGNRPAEAPGARVFSIPKGRTVPHDGDLFLPGDVIVLTRAEHAPLFSAGLLEEPWNA